MSLYKNIAIFLSCPSLPHLKISSASLKTFFLLRWFKCRRTEKKVLFEMTPSAKISLLSILLFEKELSDHYQHSNNSENTPLSLIHTQRYTEPLLLNTESRSVLLLQDILGWIANAPYTHPGVRRCCCCCV